MSRSAAAGWRSATRPPRRGASSSRPAHRHLRRRHPQRAGGRRDGRDRCSASGGLTGLVNNAAGNFIAPTESAVAARLRRHRQHRHPRQLLRDAGGRQTLDREATAGAWTAAAADAQRDEHHRHLGRQRQPVCRSVGDEQGRHRGDDEVAGGRMGALRNTAQCGRRRARSRPKGMSKRLNPGEEPGARSRERNPMSRTGEMQRTAEPGRVPDGAGPVRLAHRPEHRDGRRQRAGHRRQLLRTARVEPTPTGSRARRIDAQNAKDRAER